MVSRQYFLGHDVYAYAWHPQGQCIASVGGDGKVSIWEARTGEQVAIAAGLQGAKTVAFSPNGNMLALGGQKRVCVFPMHATTQSDSTPLSSLILSQMTSVCTLAWSPDSSRLAFGGNGWGLFIWDIGGGPTQRTFRQSVTGSPKRIQWSPDGERIAWLKGGVDAVQIGCLSDGRRSCLFFGHRRGVEDLCWSPDGGRMASCAAGYDDQTVQIWHVGSKQVALCYREHSSGVLSVCYSPDGHWLASADLEGELRVWNSQHAKTVYTWRGNAGRLSHVSWSPDGQFLSAFDERHRRILVLPMRDLLAEYPSLGVQGQQTASNQQSPFRDRYLVRTSLQEEYAPTELDALFLARTLIIETGVPTVELIDRVTGEAFEQIEAPDWGIAKVDYDLYLLYLRYYAAWHRQQKCSGAWFGYRDVVQKLERGASPEFLIRELEQDADMRQSRAVDPTINQRSAAFHRHVEEIYRQAAAEIASTQKQGAISAPESGSAEVCFPVQDRSHFSSPATQVSRSSSVYQMVCMHKTSNFYTCEIRALCWSQDSLSLVSSNGYDAVVCWSAKTGKRLAAIPDSRWTNVLALSPDNATLALGHARFVSMIPYPLLVGGHVSNEGGSQKKCPDLLTHLLWLPDSEHFITSVANGSAQLWRMGRKKAKHRYQSENRSKRGALALSPCGRYFASIVWVDRTRPDADPLEYIEVREVATGDIVTTYRGHTRGIEDLAWSASGAWIVSVASGYDDYTAHVWQALTGKQQLIYAGQEQRLRCVDVSPDGGHVVTGGYDGLTCMWDIATGETEQLFELENSITCVAFSPDGTRLAIGDCSGCIYLWNVHSSHGVDLVR